VSCGFIDVFQDEIIFYWYEYFIVLQWYSFLFYFYDKTLYGQVISTPPSYSRYPVVLTDISCGFPSDSMQMSG
jgi:hypothetical protein